MLACANHSDQAATLDCAPCRALVCAACARRLADGKTHECLRSRVDTPDFVGFMESIILPQLKYLATVLPFILIVIFAGSTLLDALELGPLALLRQIGPYALLALLWVALWPVLIIVGAITSSVAAILDPRAWVRSLRILGRDYLVAAVAFYAVLAVTALAIQPAVGWLARLPIPIVPSLLGHFVLVALMALRARILGEACRPHMGL